MYILEANNWKYSLFLIDDNLMCRPKPSLHKPYIFFFCVTQLHFYLELLKTVISQPPKVDSPTAENSLQVDPL